MMMVHLGQVLELIYFACAPMIVIVGCVGLYQLKISRDTARLNARRDSLRFAATQADYYHSHIIPLQNTLDTVIKENEIKLFEKASVDIKDNTIRIRPNLESDELIKDLEKIKTISKELTQALNAMEAFAVFFISGVADEAVAFSSVGKTYCGSVLDYLPIIIPISENG